MDGHRFDALARRVALSGTRRALLRAATTTLGTGLAGMFGRQGRATARFQPSDEPIPCTSQDQCGVCGICHRGQCFPKCPLACETCDPATGACRSTCKACEACSAGGGETGGCLPMCSPTCQRCNEQNNTCEDT